jgi:hypothetical protein
VSLSYSLPGRSPALLAFLGVVLVTTHGTALSAQRLDVREDGSGHYHGLHFSHPLFTESITPDTKIRLNVEGESEDEGNVYELEAEGEYAFNRSFSIEIGVPYVTLDPDDAASTSALGNIEVALKFANFVFEDAGILLGYGFAVGLPTGSPDKGIGSDTEWELEPFLNAGIKRGPFELIGWARFGIPVNLPDGEEVENEFHYDFSGLVHAKSWLQVLVELRGKLALNGEEAGAGRVRLAPGVKVAPFGPRLFLGLGGSFPLSDEELNARVRLAAFYHF